MKLYEYQSKNIFQACGIPIPRGEVAFTLGAVQEIAKSLGGRVVVKSQVLTHKRAQAGGIRLANDPQDAQIYAEQIFSREIHGLTVQKVLVEEAIEIHQELYLAIIIDRVQRRPLLVASTRGGHDIDAIIKESPEAIIRLPIDPRSGLLTFQARNLAFDLGIRSKLIGDFVTIAEGLYRAFEKSDARLVEINPLVITDQDQFLAVDAKIELDDNALFRHPQLADKRVFQEGAPAERQAYQAGLTYIKLKGDIGCMVNGAGLAMTTMDLLHNLGGKPANFLDIGGGASAFKVATALRIILSDPDVKVILFNIFGGITRCDEVAQGILKAFDEVDTHLPVVARLAGTNGAKGREILSNARFPCTKLFEDAAKIAIEMAKGETVSWAY
ncbi:MAG: ADP-forming succinate--CoA ligase subunit beta [Chloroflexota bacterium]